MGSFRTRDQTHVSYIGMWILYHWTSSQKSIPGPLTVKFLCFCKPLFPGKWNERFYILIVLIAFIYVLVYFIVAFILNPYDPTDSVNIGQKVTISPWLFESSRVLEAYRRLWFESSTLGHGLSRALWSDGCSGFASLSKCPCSSCYSCSGAFGFKYVPCQEDWHPAFFSFTHSSEYKSLTSCKCRAFHEEIDIDWLFWVKIWRLSRVVADRTTPGLSWPIVPPDSPQDWLGHASGFKVSCAMIGMRKIVLEHHGKLSSHEVDAS